MKKTYISPAIEQESLMLEKGIAVSGNGNIIIGNDINGGTEDDLQDWTEGNLGWW